MKVNTTSPVVSIGIDAAVVAAHQIAIRGEVREDFKTPPTLAGLAKLTKRLEPYAGSLVVAEPTAGTWLPLAHADPPWVPRRLLMCPGFGAVSLFESVMLL